MKKLTATEYQMAYQVWLTWLDTFPDGFEHSGYTKTQIKKTFSAFHKILGVPELTDQQLKNWWSCYPLYDEEGQG